MKLSDITSRVRILLNDTDSSAYRWADPELTLWVNDGQRFIALIRPDSTSVNAAVTLSAGSKQAVPGTVFRLLDVIRNLASDGTTPGRVIKLTERKVLDDFDPMWHTATKVGTIKHYTYDNRVPTIFYVYPPAINGTKIEAVISRAPTDVASSGDDLTLADQYMEAEINYVMYRAFLKDAEFSGNSALSGSYMQTLLAILGVKTKKDVAFSPDLNDQGSTPNPQVFKEGGV